MRRLLTTALTTALLATGLAACGSTSTTSTSTGSTSTGSTSSDHNAADVAFATDMVPHHSQALDMVSMTTGKQLSPAVATLAQSIERAQGPEITEMQGWLEAWGEPDPDASGDMSGSMTGMMSAEQMSGLAASTGAAFQTDWLTLMVQHHEGALAMARTEVAQGQYPPAVALARSIISSQSAQIAQMQHLLSQG